MHSAPSAILLFPYSDICDLLAVHSQHVFTRNNSSLRSFVRSFVSYVKSCMLGMNGSLLQSVLRLHVAICCVMDISAKVKVTHLCRCWHTHVSTESFWCWYIHVYVLVHIHIYLPRGIHEHTYLQTQKQSIAVIFFCATNGSNGNVKGVARCSAKRFIFVLVLHPTALLFWLILTALISLLSAHPFSLKKLW